MKVKLRTVDGAIKMIDVSKAMLVKDFRKKVKEAVGIDPKRQRLLFRGKQMEDGCDLLDYRIEMGTIIDVTERVILKDVDSNSKDSTTSSGSDKKKAEKEDPPKFSEEREPDDPAPSTGGSSSATGTGDDQAKQTLEAVRNLCSDLADEMQKDLQSPPCKKCKDDKDKKCKECGCSVCGGKDNEDKQLFCEQCEYTTHLWCLDPPLDEVPDVDDWYCPDCKNDGNEIVQAGELGNKFSHRQNKMPSRQKGGNKRDWGKGFATVGKTKTCTLVPSNHFGPIPGIDVGMCWKYRIQCSEEGVHRPPVAGIAGRAEEGCQSIVLAGGYEDDTDNGNEFIYTGSGGRDLSGNKRTAEQSSDQVLEKMNLAIARNCDAPVDKVNGAEAKNWKKGKPIRVIRSCKLKKHSTYAPDDGNRYDGLYKVVKYWPEKGRSGFLVWRYLLRRDDPNPAPWEEGATKYECIIPEVLKEEAKESEDGGAPQAKKSKLQNFQLDDETKKMTDEDTLNANLWKTCLEFEGDKKAWYDHVQETFCCIICQDLVVKPVTLPCLHNICLSCLERSFKAEVYTCPYCRHDLGKEYEKPINTACEAVLQKLFQK